MSVLKQSLSILLSGCLLFVTMPRVDGQAPGEPPPMPMTTAPLTPEQLDQLVAPIALYPDPLVAQILAASTYPAQVVEADRWMQQHPGMQGQELGQQVDQQVWDPSVKALTETPAVLANMDKNITWTSALGDAYTNQRPQVMQAVQEMRKRAQAAGNLKTVPQEQVVNQGPDIAIQPASPEVVYVPQYDPWLVYGDPIVAWPGWYPYPGLFLEGPGLAFGLGFGIGFFGGFGWGWPRWGFDWHRGGVIFDHHAYISNSRTFYNRSNFSRFANHGNFGGRGFDRGAGFREGGGEGSRGSAERGFSGSRGSSGRHGSAFSGFNRGGVTRGFSQRGFSSFHGGGGGFHGGGGRR